MNPFAFSLLLILSPLVSQIILGTQSLLNKIRWQFNTIATFTIILEVVFIFIGIQLIAIDAEKQAIHCGLPQAALVFFGIFILGVLVITIGIQQWIRAYRAKKNKDSF